MNPVLKGNYWNDLKILSELTGELSIIISSDHYKIISKVLSLYNAMFWSIGMDGVVPESCFKEIMVISL